MSLLRNQRPYERLGIKLSLTFFLNVIISFMMESLILAQIERWRHGLGMQVEREALAC